MAVSFPENDHKDEAFIVSPKENRDSVVFLAKSTAILDIVSSVKKYFDTIDEDLCEAGINKHDLSIRKESH